MFNRKDQGGKVELATSGADAQPPARTGANAFAPQEPRRVRLDEIDRADRRFFLRDANALTEGSLKDLMASIQHEGIQVPIEFTESGGRKVLVKGFRRVEACVLLARKVPDRFKPDMELDAVQVHEASDGELLVRSVLDNSVRKSLDQVERIRAARSLFLASVPEGRAAEALGVSVQSYKRDLLIAESPWMFGHVVANEVSPTPASTLLRAIAEGEKEHPGVGARARAELGRWVEEKKLWIDRRDKIAKAKKGRGQGLSAADKQVRKYLTSQMAEHWADLIRRGESLDEKAEWTFRADLDPEKDLLLIGGVRLDLAKDPVRKLVEVASKLSQLAKDIGPVLQKRHAEEQRRDRPAGRGVIRDTRYLRDLGLEDYADEYELELRELAEAGQDGEEDPDFGRDDPRHERDLAAEVDAPEARSTTETDAGPAPSDDGGDAR